MNKSPYPELHNIQDNIVIIKVSGSEISQMSSEELYERVRAAWHNRFEYVAPAKYCLATYQGVILDVYEIIEWKYANQLDRPKYRELDAKETIRIGFEGRPAPEEVRRRYQHHSVKHLFPKGNSSVVRVFMKGEV